MNMVPSHIRTMMVTGCAFFRMGSNFLRLVQSLGPMLDRDWRTPCLAAPSQLALDTAAELQDFHIRNFRGFTECSDDMWSSDEEAERDIEGEMDEAQNKSRADRRRRHYLYKEDRNRFREILMATSGAPAGAWANITQ